MKENRKLLREVLRDIRRDMTDEEVLNLLADSKISVSPESEKEKYTVGQRAADAIAKFAGSWAFIFSFTGILILWMVINAVLAANAFDPYPFILLNLVLSCVAAIQAPLIMMSQNRQEEKDRRRAENDYKVNLKTFTIRSTRYSQNSHSSKSDWRKRIRIPIIRSGKPRRQNPVFSVHAHHADSCRAVLLEKLIVSKSPYSDVTNVQIHFLDLRFSFFYIYLPEVKFRSPK